MPSKNAKPRWGNYGVGFMPAYHLSKNDEKALCKELSRILKKDVTDDFLNTFKGLISSYRRRRHQEKLEPKNTEVAEELKQLRKAVQPLLAHLGKEADEAYESNYSISISAKAHINGYLEIDDKLLCNLLNTTGRKNASAQPQAETAYPVEQISERSIIVLGTPQAIRETLKANGVKYRGIYNEKRGGLVFPVKRTEKIRTALQKRRYLINRKTDHICLYRPSAAIIPYFAECDKDGNLIDGSSPVYESEDSASSTSTITDKFEQQLSNDTPVITQLAESLIQFNSAIDMALEDFANTPSENNPRSPSRRWLASNLAIAFIDILKITPPKTKGGIFEKCLTVAIRESGEEAPQHLTPLSRQAIDYATNLNSANDQIKSFFSAPPVK